MKAPQHRGARIYDGRSSCFEVLERFEAEFVRLSGEGVALAVKFPKSKRLAKR